MRTTYTGKRYDYGKSDHAKALSRALEYVDESQKGKREIEREGLLATKHLCSWLDESKHPWTTKVYDPIFHGALEARRAKVAEAFFSSPPLYDFVPEEDTPWEKAEAMTRVCDLHEQQVAAHSRQSILMGFSGQASVGTQCWGLPWVFRQAERGQWVESDLKTSFVDPVTGMRQRVTIPGGGAARRERVLTTVYDGPMALPKHITQWGCDTRNPDYQQGGWFFESDHIEAREARLRIKDDNWDRDGVERAIRGDAPLDSLMGPLDWYEEIGLVVAGAKAGLEMGSKKERRTVEVIEIYTREKYSIRRQVILNRAYIVWDGPSPYDHGLFPYIVTRNYSILGQFWGLSDYRITRYLIRGIQQMRNAVVNEGAWRANPPLLHDESIELELRYEPRAKIPMRGDPNLLRFLTDVGGASSMSDANNVAQLLQDRFDAGLGSSEQARGSAGKKGTTATAADLAFRSAGLKDKLLIDDFGDSHIVPRAEMFRMLIEQHETRLRYWREGPRAEPVPVYPEDFRGGQLRPVARVTTDPLKEIQEKRLLDLYNLAAKNQEPHIKREGLVEGLLELIVPDKKSLLFKSQEEIDTEQREAQQKQAGMEAPPGAAPPGPSGPRTGQYQSPFPAGGPNEMGAMMAEAL